MSCTCPPDSPFRWKESQPKLNVARMSQDVQRSQHSTKVVNDQRKRGIDGLALGNLSERQRKTSIDPKKFVTAQLK